MLLTVAEIAHLVQSHCLIQFSTVQVQIHSRLEALKHALRSIGSKRIADHVFGSGLFVFVYRVAQKMATSSNINRFSNLLHCQNQERITKDPTTPQVCRYTTL